MANPNEPNRRAFLKAASAKAAASAAGANDDTPNPQLTDEDIDTLKAHQLLQITGNYYMLLNETMNFPMMYSGMLEKPIFAIRSKQKLTDFVFRKRQNFLDSKKRLQQKVEAFTQKYGIPQHQDLVGSFCIEGHDNDAELIKQFGLQDLSKLFDPSFLLQLDILPERYGQALERAQQLDKLADVAAPLVSHLQQQGMTEHSIHRLLSDIFTRYMGESTDYQGYPRDYMLGNPRYTRRLEETINALKERGVHEITIQQQSERQEKGNQWSKLLEKSKSRVNQLLGKASGSNRFLILGHSKAEAEKNLHTLNETLDNVHHVTREHYAPKLEAKDIYCQTTTTNELFHREMLPPEIIQQEQKTYGIDISLAHFEAIEAFKKTCPQMAKAIFDNFGPAATQKSTGRS